MVVCLEGTCRCVTCLLSACSPRMHPICSGFFFLFNLVLYYFSGFCCNFFNQIEKVKFRFSTSSSRGHSVFDTESLLGRCSQHCAFLTVFFIPSPPSCLMVRVWVHGFGWNQSYVNACKWQSTSSSSFWLFMFEIQCFISIVAYARKTCDVSTFFFQCIFFSPDIFRRTTGNDTRRKTTTTWMIRQRLTWPGANTSCWTSPSSWLCSRASSSPQCSAWPATASHGPLKHSCTCRCPWPPPASAPCRCV